MTASPPNSEDTQVQWQGLEDSILGVAIFDINGLPREYFVTDDNRSTSWVQIVFQALGLRSLLAASLQLEGFQHIAVDLTETTAVVVRRRYDYVGLLVQGNPVLTINPEPSLLIQWIAQLTLETLADHPRFHTA
ncbi:MAG: hypothetical protein HC812_06295 [Leptolyngbya sp. RL_3_1]|nr:hypothetical protein [Leptolyngbya sp. RL_3_1]